ncbi:hypothetical protein C2E23DRAFT_829669 [Lenzites betulinus]|nr:hypothetical protein C2E23DRAFT_829669 [Lenzites betulinus]
MAQTKRITLYTAVDSPFPHRVRLALEEAKVEYSVIMIDLLAKPEWYEKKVNPKGGRVPSLIYGGQELHPDEAPSADAARLIESNVILEFLADTFPGLLPTDPLLRAHARLAILRVDAALLMPFISFIFLNAPAETVHVEFERFQEMLPPTGYLAGEWSIADASFVPILIRWVGAIESGLGTFTPEARKESQEAWHSPRFARLRKYYEDNMARPSMAKTLDVDGSNKQMAKRIERFRRTGMINSDLRFPVPKSQ